MQLLLPVAVIFGISATQVAAADVTATAVVQVLPSARIGTRIDADDRAALVVMGDGAVSVRSGGRTIEMRDEGDRLSADVGVLSDGELLVEYL